MDNQIKQSSSNSSISSNSSNEDIQQHYNRNVWHVTSFAAKSKIESKVKQLEKISAEIYRNPDASHEEKEIHKYLCDIMTKIGCEVNDEKLNENI
jgi:hypothetical protein